MNDGRRRRRLFTVNAELPPYVSLTAGVLALVACPVKAAPKLDVTDGWAVLPDCPTYYVASWGDDDNAGTQDSPWQTIAKVNAHTFSSPSRVLFKGGQTFAGRLIWDATNHAGHAQKPFVFGSYGGKAIIKPTDASHDGFFAQNPEHLRIENLIFEGTGSTTNTARGIHLTSDQTVEAKLEGVTVSGCEVRDFGVDGILARASAWPVASGFDGLVIEDCHVHDCTGNAVQDYGVGIYVVGAYGLGHVDVTAGVSHENVTIRSCLVHDCIGKAAITKHTGNGILVAEVDNGLIEYCVAHTNGEFGNAPVGIWMFDSLNTTIQFCESYNNKSNSTKDGGGFGLDGGCQGCLIQYCYSHDNMGSGLQMFHYEHFDYLLPFSNNIIRYNLANNNGTGNSAEKGEFLIGNGENEDCAGNKVYHNTFVSDVENGAGVHLSNNTYNNRITTSFIRNNIFHITGPGSKLVRSGGSTVLSLTSDLNYNIYYTDQSNPIKWGATTYASVAAYVTATGYDDDSIVDDPLLTGSFPVGAVGAYKPSALGAFQTAVGSPAIGAAETLVGVGDQDYFGNTLPVSGRDIGAFQW